MGGCVHYAVVLQLLILLMLANGSPVVAKRIFGKTFARPLDGTIKFVDSRPLFGPSKTIRGILAAIFTTSAAAPLLGLSPLIGLIVATTSMAGDLLSSFVKRRIGLQPSSKAMGLDQIPESLFPLLTCCQMLSLTALDVVVGTAIFFGAELVLSRVLFKLHVRDRPY
jgi:CDP-archaeol synthase